LRRKPLDFKKGKLSSTAIRKYLSEPEDSGSNMLEEGSAVYISQYIIELARSG